MKTLCKRTGKIFTEYRYLAAAYSGDNLPCCPYCGEKGREGEMHATPYDSDWGEWHEGIIEKEGKMTVNTLETAKAVVEEAGKESIGFVFQYKHSETGKTLYAVFMKEQYCDIYDSPYCADPVMLFENGEWVNRDAVKVDGGMKNDG